MLKENGISESGEVGNDGFVKHQDNGNRKRGRYVLFPMLKSGAVVACAIAIATVGAIGVAANAVDSEFEENAAVQVAHETSADDGVETRQAATVGKEEPGDESLASTDASTAATEESVIAGEHSSMGKAEQVLAAEENASSPAGAASPAAPEEASGNNAVNAPADDDAASDSSQPAHQHSWVAEMKTVDHPAEYKDVYHEATYEDKKWTQCNACKDDITGKVAAHLAEHAMAGESASYHTENTRVCTAEAWTEYSVLVKEGYSEEVPTGSEVCSCGAHR